MASNERPFRDIVAELRRLCMNRSNGNYFVMSDDGALFQVGLREGEIVHVFFRGRRGKEALPQIASMKSGVPSFSEGPVLAARLPLPPTQEILDYLGATPLPSASPASTPAPAPAPGNPLGGQLPAATAAVLQEELTRLIGPFAAIICAERLTAAADLETALSVLSKELHTAGHAAQFRSSVLSRLGLR